MIGEPRENEFDDGEEEEAWDEFQWEEFMKRSDERVDMYGELMEKYGDDPDAEKKIAKEMGWDWLVEALEAQEREELPEEPEEGSWIDEEEEGEEWKKQTGFETAEGRERGYPLVYYRAFEHDIAAHDFVETIRGKFPNEKCIGKFMEGATVPSAKIAGAQAFVDNVNMLGGAIANCKRGLNAANQCLEAIQTMEGKQIMDEQTALRFYTEAKAVRDELAVYIAELRERFQNRIP